MVKPMPLLYPSRPEATPRSERPPRLGVMVAYQDLAAAYHARATCGFLARKLRGEFAVDCRFWSFRALGVPDLQPQAARDASQADLLIVSSHPTEAAPPEFLAWVDSWDRQKCQPLATVSLLDPPIATASQSSPVRRHLQQVAHQLGIPFFAQPDLWPGSFEAGLASGGIPAAQLPPTPPVDIFRPEGNCAHWGINE